MQIIVKRRHSIQKYSKAEKFPLCGSFCKSLGEFLLYKIKLVQKQKGKKLICFNLKLIHFPISLSTISYDMEDVPK